MGDMVDFKMMIGEAMIAFCLFFLILIACSHFCKWSRPEILRENKIELTILTFVSLIMGIVLVFL
jgi:hypothetical protein